MKRRVRDVEGPAVQICLDVDSLMNHLYFTVYITVFQYIRVVPGIVFPLKLKIFVMSFTSALCGSTLCTP